MDKALYDVVSSKTIKASRFEIVEDKLKIDGRDAKYSFVKIRPGICVIVETPDGFVLLKEYRYPIKSWTYEFTAGCIDEGESPEEAARREIQEETGYIADEIICLGDFYPSFGPTDEKITLFCANCNERTETKKEYTEFITHELVSGERIEELIMSGEFKHGAGLAAWLKYRLYRQRMADRPY
ncbi:MAG: NUDIX hydrolase [Clostridia bacterium]|nr:NUDIX hydrolase [Clostridia bacterium]